MVNSCIQVNLCNQTIQQDSASLRFTYKKGYLRYLKTATVKLLACHSNDEETLDNLNSTTDLVTGVYEGGFKVWECSKDIIEFICDSTETGKPLVDEHSRVLEVISRFIRWLLTVV